MRKFGWIFMILTLPLSGIGQSSAIEKAKLFIINKSAELDLSPSDADEWIVSDMYTSDHNGITHIYLQQAHNGIPLYNAIYNVNMSRDNEIIHTGDRLVRNINDKISGDKVVLSPSDALEKQLQEAGLASKDLPAILKSDKPHSWTFEQTEYSAGEIKAALVYYPSGEELRLAYRLELLEQAAPHFWNTVVDAVTGEIIKHDDATVYCSFEKGRFHNHDRACRHFDSANALIGEVDSIPASYRVYALPAESPIHGPHVLVHDPRFPEASPFGWHDVNGEEGAEFTITRGNNVHAYRDADDTGLSANDEPDGGPELIFDFPHNRDGEPDVSLEADITNLFYMNNMMHDISYLFGFDEEAGNFQNNNYGNGGVGGDYVNAQGQDGANILDGDHLNNANFSTPGDGQSGRMQMYYWSQTQSSTFIEEPQELAGGLEVVVPTADDWGFNYATQFSQVDITARVVVVDDGTFANPTRGCNPLQNGDVINGNLAMIDRGICEFGTKALNAQEAGAVAALICNVPGVNGGDGEEGVNMGGGQQGINVTIPAIFMKHSDCELIKASLNAGVDVIINIKERTNAGPDYFSSSFDNGVVAHEYGHGISTRLTGGPSSSGCLSNGEQMGEGWSDFFALITTVEPGDLGSDRRGIGNYVDGFNVDGRGIRRFPYSTDMNINPQTMKDILTAGGVHGVGEVWADVIWDMYWAFVDVYGWDADWTNTQSGNFMAVQLVMDGMKLQPCNPGFLDGRDAILAADRINYGGIHECMIWDVFARRGMGYFADQGSNDSAGDNVEDFESLPTCIKELKIRKDITNVLVPGEETEVILTFANHTDSTETNVTVLDELPDNAIFIDHDSDYDSEIIDNTVVFNIGDMPSLMEDTIRYVIQSDPSVRSALLYADDVEDPDAQNANWNREIIEGSNFWQLNGLEDFSFSGFSSWYITEIQEVSKSDLIYQELDVVGENPVLRFWHMFNTTTSVNGGYVEISTDGILWEDAGDLFIRNGYPTALNYSTFAIPSLRGFSGDSEGFVDSYISLAPYMGERIMIRFKFGTDETTSFFAPDNGWFVDNIELIDLVEYSTEACINSDFSAGCSETKKSIIDAALISSSAEAVNNQLEWSVYPNPAHDYSIVEINAAGRLNSRLSVLTMNGQLLYSKDLQTAGGSKRLTLNTHSWPAGMYILRLNSDNQILTKKMMIH